MYVATTQRSNYRGHKSKTHILQFIFLTFVVQRWSHEQRQFCNQPQKVETAHIIGLALAFHPQTPTEQPQTHQKKKDRNVLIRSAKSVTHIMQTKNPTHKEGFKLLPSIFQSIIDTWSMKQFCGVFLQNLW